MTPRGLILALKSPFSGPPLAVINLALAHLLFPRLHVAWPVIGDVVVSSVALLSLGVYLYTRRAIADPRRSSRSAFATAFNEPIAALASRPAPWPASIARAPRRGRA